jgi:hypothetical protein
LEAEILTKYEQQFGALEAKLKSIGERPVDTSRPDWPKELSRQPDPLDEAGVRTEAESLLTGLIELYARAPATREKIRALFKGHRMVSWALWPPFQPNTEEHFRSWLVTISMKDQARDARDALSALWVKCRTAADAGVNIVPALESVAMMSNDRNWYGMGSMRSMMLEAPHRYKTAR